MAQLAQRDKSNPVETIWSPQEGPQAAALHCPVKEIMYGGARGGGKTELALAWMATRCEIYGSKHAGIFFRREFKQLEQVIDRAKEFYFKLDAKWSESKAMFTFPNGATVKFRHLDSDSDAELYQGHEYQSIVFEEIANWPSIAPIRKLKAVMRSAAGVPCQMLGTCNPSGPGMLWVKKRYIDPAPMGWKIIKEKIKVELNGQVIETESERVFIPSKVTDNKILLQKDPGYITNLAQSGSAALVKAWLDGDWNAVDGGFFTEWSQSRHVLRTSALPDWWLRFRAGDWGSARPGAYAWFAVASEDWTSACGKLVPKGAMVAYREHYTVKIKNDGDFEPNVGTREYAEVVGAKLAQLESGDPEVNYGVIDPAAFTADGGPSIVERMYWGSKGRILFRRADNKRTPGRGAMGGWDQMRSRLGGEDVLGTGQSTPMLFLMDCCEHGIRTIPMMQHDKNNPEDMDTDGEDHWVDMCRYACMSRPYTQPTPKDQEAALGVESMTLEDMWEMSRADQLELEAPQRI